MIIETKFDLGQLAVHDASSKLVVIDSISYDGIVGYWCIYKDDPTKKFWCREHELRTI
jgi:hypothetical protein